MTEPKKEDRWTLIKENNGIGEAGIPAIKASIQKMKCSVAGIHILEKTAGLNSTMARLNRTIAILNQTIV